MNKPTKHSGKLKAEFCIASVHDNGRWPGFHQCENKRKPDSVWCGTHTWAEITKDTPKLWAVEASDYYPDKAKLVSVPIVKETAKRITIGHTCDAFGYKSTVTKGEDGKLSYGARTREDALQRFLAKCNQGVERAEIELAAMKVAQQTAEKLLKKG